MGLKEEINDAKKHRDRYSFLTIAAFVVAFAATGIRITFANSITATASVSTTISIVSIVLVVLGIICAFYYSRYSQKYRLLKSKL